MEDDNNSNINITNSSNDNDIDITTAKNELINAIHQYDNELQQIQTSINTYKQREDTCKETLDNLLKEHPNQNNNDDALAYENEIKAKTLHIQELTKEYMAYIKDSKRQNQEIRRLRKEIEYNANYDRILTLHRLIEEEQIKHNELTLQLRALNIVNTNKLPNVNEYESGSSLESEIEQIKHSIKQYQDKHTKQERFLNLIHEKIISIEMTIKHMKEDKQLKQKQFTQEQLQLTLDEINMLNKKIEENRNMLNNINRNSTLKMKNLMEKNKEIETEFMRNQKENRKLMFKKNELKRKIRLIEEGDKKGNNGVHKGNNRFNMNNKHKYNKEVIVSRDVIKHYV